MPLDAATRMAAGDDQIYIRGDTRCRVKVEKHDLMCSVGGVALTEFGMR